MKDYTKEELEILLKSFKIFKQHDENDRQSLSSMESKVKELYIIEVSKDL